MASQNVWGYRPELSASCARPQPGASAALPVLIPAIPTPYYYYGFKLLDYQNNRAYVL